MLVLDFSTFPILSTKRLILRPVTKADATEVFKLRSDSNVMKYIDRPRATTIDDAINLIQRIEDGITNNEGIAWALTLKESNTLIGIISFHRIEKENYRAELGYILASNFHRKGLMQEAVTAILDYGFNSMKLHSVEATINPANAISAKLLEKNGFVREAYFKENFYFNDRFLDSAIYSLLHP
jgi:ribosomal-protein-alanine N-acetyltransferase